MIGLVVLAAGKGSRLEGIAAPYYKPLLVVNGQALLVSALDTNRFAESVVVLSPMNAAPAVSLVSSAIARPVHYVLQPEADGPGDALRRGLIALAGLGCDSFVTIMGDNTTDDKAINAVIRAYVEEGAELAVHVQQLPAHEAERFTWHEDDTWHEKDKVHPSGLTVDCWLGPIAGNTSAALEALSTLAPRRGTEVLISPIFSILDTVTVSSDAVIFDIGTPDMTETMT